MPASHSMAPTWANHGLRVDADWGGVQNNRIVGAGTLTAVLLRILHTQMLEVFGVLSTIIPATLMVMRVSLRPGQSRHHTQTADELPEGLAARHPACQVPGKLV